MLKLTKPTNDYLIALSTPHGIMQHTMYNLPDPEHGYATDDNARALIIAHLWKNRDPKKRELMRTLEVAYLRFLKFAQEKDGRFSCYVSFDLKKTGVGVGDWYGRSFFALAFLAHKSKLFEKPAWEMLMTSLPQLFINDFSLRTHCFVILGLHYVFKKQEVEGHLKKNQADHVRRYLRLCKTQFEEKALANFSKNWDWPQDTITYDNGKVIQGYLVLGELLADKPLMEMGRRMLDFYLDVTFENGYFQAPGNKGFWHKNKKRPLYDEQCVEAYSLVSALVTADRLFKDKKYLFFAKKTYQWFWGKNRLGKSLVTDTGAVYDGLRVEELNTNQGAESYLSLHLAYFALTEKILL